MTASSPSGQVLRDPAHLAELCASVFSSIPRADQRRWAAAYVHGLVRVPGRKSIRRICEHYPGPATEQCLQQFVNQSPWRWAPVRQSLGQAAEVAAEPRAWVVDEVEFPKRGRYSVGVAVQYVPSLGRTINCQLGLSTWVVGADAAVPTDWRLMLPPSWDEDRDRRRRAYVPDREQHLPAWQHVLHSVDEMVESWGLTPRPVVADRRHDQDVEALTRGLEERQLRFALQISGRTPVARSSSGRVRAADLVRATARELIGLPADSSSGTRSRRSGPIMVAHAAVPPVPAPGRRLPLPVVPRRVVGLWPHGRSRPGELWLTNLSMSPLPHLVDVLASHGQVVGRLRSLRDDSGLDHFEGRSYAGWHHHVTLASVAYAHRELAAVRRAPTSAAS